MRFRTGMSGTPMPSFKDAATDGEMWDLANYVVSLARKPRLGDDRRGSRGVLRARRRRREGQPGQARRSISSSTLGCALCHSPVDDEKRMLPGLRLAGGLRMHVEPFGDYPTGNLTSDKETGLGNWTDDEIKRVDHARHPARRHAAAAVSRWTGRRSRR